LKAESEDEREKIEKERILRKREYREEREE
jgi:hypothetical protein